MKAFEMRLLSMAVRAVNTVKGRCRRITEKLGDESAEGYMDTLIKILISVVLGVALLAALKLFIFDKFFPELEQQIMDMFAGTSDPAGGGGGATP